MRRILIMTLSVCLFWTGCGEAPKKDSNKITVYTTLYPLMYFTQRIGAERVEALNVLPPGVDPHDFELTPKDVLKINKSKLLVYNGVGLETWIDKLKQTMPKDGPTVVNSSIGMSRKDLLQGKHHVDPHTWLNPMLAKRQALNIKNALAKIDPTNSQFYEKNFVSLAKDLDKLDQEFQASLTNVKEKRIVVAHAAFAYLVQRYGLEQLPISGLSPSYEPSPRELKVLANKVRKSGIKYIFFESALHPKVGEALLRECKALPLILNPLEMLTKEDIEHNKDYFSIMRSNKENLVKALGAAR